MAETRESSNRQLRHKRVKHVFMWCWLCPWSSVRQDLSSICVWLEVAQRPRLVLLCFQPCKCIFGNLILWLYQPFATESARVPADVSVTPHVLIWQAKHISSLSTENRSLKHASTCIFSCITPFSQAQKYFISNLNKIFWTLEAPTCQLRNQTDLTWILRSFYTLILVWSVGNSALESLSSHITFLREIFLRWFKTQNASTWDFSRWDDMRVSFPSIFISGNRRRCRAVAFHPSSAAVSLSLSLSGSPLPTPTLGSTLHYVLPGLPVPSDHWAISSTHTHQQRHQSQSTGAWSKQEVPASWIYEDIYFTITSYFITTDADLTTSEQP